MNRAEMVEVWEARPSSASHSGIAAKSIASLIVTIALIAGSPQLGFADTEQLALGSHEMEFHPGVDDVEVDATFPFTNAGTSSVTITDITTSCACTTAADDKR